MSVRPEARGADRMSDEDEVIDDEAVAAEWEASMLAEAGGDEEEGDRKSVV